MPTRREQLFNAKNKTSSTVTVIPATVQFNHDKKLGEIKPLQAHEKMLCALRKCLAKMSDGDGGQRRYYIANNKVQILDAPSSTAGKAGEARSYRARGRCKLGVCLPDNTTKMLMVEFTISFRDTIDDRGMADVEYFDPTTIDVIGKDTPVDVTALA